MLRAQAGPLVRQLRAYCTVSASEAEKAIANKLKASLKSVQQVEVQDTSGGCGAMYRISIVAEDFKGQSIVKQHQLVHKILAEDLRQWHGLTLQTSAPPAQQ
ncbi:bola-like protein [Volvox carteri f. nagariensis]|uniref:Bola-like protein n=1 Tax=Volvox carteri f. nagariensis TaxID=3068 RepID=D8U6Z8_VOLCA|nr:bola-like protein [Volvox carteri f. nagariensis]EFJ44525.1 bola-like protein [Volvox carteri f. nagariensis]|eukprot:XP_002954375.1 bola-like protein [Volvox carteri f. nagariensis]